MLPEQREGCKPNVSLHTPLTYGHIVYTDFPLNYLAKYKQQTLFSSCLDVENHIQWYPYY